jgi:hypothetical protein
MKKDALLKTLNTLMGAKDVVTEEDLAKVEDTLKKPNSVVLYIRGNMMVERTKTPARDDQGIILVDAPAVSKLVICSGKPKAVLVAFEDAGKLLIGWSKRNDDLDMAVDKKAMEFAAVVKNLSPVDFLVRLEEFVKSANLLDREIAFSKQVGRALAMLRAKGDEIVMGKNHGTSSKTGKLPNEIFKALPRFIARAEKVTGMKPANVRSKVLVVTT